MVREISSATNIIFCLFGIFFALLPPIRTQKIKILKKWKRKKKHLEISSFYTSVPKIMIICYTVPEIWHVTDVIVIFHFGLFFALLQPKKSNFKKKKVKNSGDIIILHTPVYHKFWLDDVRFLRYGAQQTDGQTDGKSDI